MEDVRVEDVRRQARECDRNERESLEQMTNEQKEDRRKQKAAERQRAFRQRKSNEFASEELEEQRKQRAEHQRTYRQRNSNSLTPEVREDKKKQNAERQRAYRERKSNELTAEEREEQRKKRAEQQRDYRQRKSQRIAYDVILDHYRSGFDPLRMIIQGTAGTGKSYLIGAIKNTLDSVSLPGKSPLLLLAPTGVAAFNISATTIHSALHIPIKEITHLQGPQLITLQEEMKYVKYILIDEMSFIGRNLLIKIDSRLRQAFPESANIPFGGRSIILVGDLGQLPPVMDKPVYASEGLAKELWNSFTTVVTLDTVFRQDGQSNEQKTFRHLLMNVRDAIPTLEDWKILMTRTDTSLDASMKEPFDKAIHLFATNDDVHNHNKRLIRSLNCPIAASIATSIRSNYSMERDEEDLELELLIAVGARVMLTSNLWTDAGLVNGALGVIQQIVYNPGSSPPEPPTYVLVRFDNYLGVPWDESIPQVVPITPIEKGNKKQLPLKLAWGLTIHKSQGLTLEKATINIGKQERQGMTFTAISRVKDLAGLRFQPPFSYDRYEKMSKLPGVKIRKDEEDRLKLITM